MERTTDDHAQPVPAGWTLGILGASGGVGASTLASAIAVRCGAAGRPVVAIDGRPWGGGLDLRLGLEEEAGLRWPDLTGLRGRPDGQALLAELPRQGGLWVLSWDRRPPRVLPSDAGAVVTALAAAAGVAVCDLPRPEASLAASWWAACDAVVLVVGGTVDGFAAASLLGEAVGNLTGLVVRRDRGSVPADTLEAALGLPVLAVLETDHHVPADLVRGSAVGGRGRLATCADVVLSALAPSVRQVA